jgi:hypothetical protein
MVNMVGITSLAVRIRARDLAVVADQYYIVMAVKAVVQAKVYRIHLQLMDAGLVPAVAQAHRTLA